MTILSQIFDFLPYGIAIFTAIVFHEIAHGLAALYCGDETAKNKGRLTLNPFRHVDLFGTIVFPTLLILTNAPFAFGWAKPVPVDFSCLKHPKKDMVIVAAAGPLTNFVLAILSFVFLSFFKNVLEISPDALIVKFLVNMIVFNFSLMAFNLIPILPMDGGRILTGLLPMRLAILFSKTEKYGFFILITLLIFIPFIGDNAGVNLDIIPKFLGFFVQKLLYFFTNLFLL